MTANPTILGAAAVFLLVGLVSFGWALAGPAAGRRHTVLVLTWLCVALTATLVIFSFFPAAEVEGSMFGFSLGGAGAFVMLVWTSAIRAGARARADDRRDAATAGRDRELAQLRRRLAEREAERAPQVVPGSARYTYPVRGARGRVLGIIAGDIRRVTDVDAWASSENTDMEMSRCYERSMSALVRYEGARRDPAGHVVEDVIRHELAERTAGQRPVVPAAAVLTGAGELAARNNVRCLVHVAAVHGEPGFGYRQVGDVGRCASNLLTLLDGVDGVSSVVMPLFGAGSAGAELLATARALSDAAVHHLRTRSGPVAAVYLLAYTDAELTACRAALDAMPELGPPTAAAPPGGRGRRPVSPGTGTAG